MGEEGRGIHDNRGVKEEVRRWRMLMTTMMVVVGHDDETNDIPPNNVTVADINSGCGNKNPVAHGM